MPLTDAERAVIAQIADLPREDVCPACGRGYIDPSPWSRTGFCAACSLRHAGADNFPGEKFPPASGRVVKPRQVWRAISSSMAGGYSRR